MLISPLFDELFTLLESLTSCKNQYDVASQSGLTAPTIKLKTNFLFKCKETAISQLLQTPDISNMQEEGLIQCFIIK